MAINKLVGLSESLPVEMDTAHFFLFSPICLLLLLGLNKSPFAVLVIHFILISGWVQLYLILTLFSCHCPFLTLFLKLKASIELEVADVGGICGLLFILQV